MTHKNTQSVRKETETAANFTRIPTFEEVYEMPYVQDSIRAIIDFNAKRFPVLASYKDDIQQEMLLALNDALPKYDGRAGLKTFIRVCLENSLKNIRRKYYREQELALYYASDISDFDDPDANDNDVPPEDVDAFISQCHNTVEDDILLMDIKESAKRLPEQTREILDRLLDGESMNQIEKSMNLSHSAIRRNHMNIIKKEVFDRVF